MVNFKYLIFKILILQKAFIFFIMHMTQFIIIKYQFVILQPVVVFIRIHPT